MASHTITNTDDGPRGFWHQDRVIMLEAGEKAKVTDMTDDEVTAAKAPGYFDLTGGASDEAAEPGPLDQSVAKLTEYLKSVTDADQVQKLIDAETAGKSRDGALAALEARRDAILAE